MGNTNTSGKLSLTHFLCLPAGSYAVIDRFHET
ncbi:hypothetical protein AERO8C_150276 [Aeromonas veronii]|jgi:hypothetical protein|uniref:Uncharacterized protein n=1 Tax=Aeromonas veronii TaxID=654 RepID=A0A653KWN6_AERVE|nr:hypothetical protein AERO8C_150276 [Aeromonas veronii]